MQTAEFEVKELEFLINHVCFPIKLPQTVDETDKKYEGLFLKLVSEVIFSLPEFKLLKGLEKEFEEIIRMFREWEVIQRFEFLEPKNISKSIEDLRTGQTLALYLRAQNACFMIKVTNDERYVISAFQSSATNHQIMSASSELIGIYPSFSFYVANTEILKSQSFSNQLADLSAYERVHSISNKANTEQIEIRDVSKPDLVFEWLPSVLIPNLCSADVESSPKIVKKIRDDIVHSNKLYPFRRSGFWMTIKVVLQLRLCELFGSSKGKLIYKSILMLVIDKLCLISKAHILTSDLKLQMIKKLARRLYKIDLLAKESNHEHLITDLLNRCASTIENIKINLNECFNKIVESARSVTGKLDLNKMKPEDRKYKNLFDITNEIARLKIISTNAFDSTVGVPYFSPRNLDCVFPNLEYLEKSECAVTALYDIECWVMNQDIYNLIKTEKINSLSLFNLMEKYLEKANEIYENDELGNSRMIITCIKIVCLLDRIAVNECTFFYQHHPGLDIKPLESLLLPRSTEMLYCQDLKEYIEQRSRISEHPYYSVIDCENMTKKTSFGVRYAAQDEKMQNLKNVILEDAKVKTELKKEELKKQRIIYSKLLEKINLMDCDFVISVFISSHSKDCVKCRLQRQAHDMQVDVYEWPLPNDNDKIDAVIFELLIPDWACCLRNALHLLKTKAFGFIYENKKELYGTLAHYNAIKIHSIETSRLVTLGSMTKLFSESHYKSKHPSSPDSNFFVPNGYSVSFCDANSVFRYKNEYDLEKLCTFSVTKPYDCLEWSISGTSHTENEVLSEKTNCPKELGLREFVKFGSFRAGHRLQMRNLLDAIETRGLSFKHSAVLSLIKQALWQIGPLNSEGEIKDKNGFLYPSSHVDLKNPEYIKKLHDMLSNFLSLSSKCWSDHIIIINIIIIALRAISLSSTESYKERLFSLIFECRKILSDWIIKLESIISACKEKEYLVKQNEEKLFEIHCAMILTYYTDRRDFQFHVFKHEHIKIWLKSMNFIHDNKILHDISNFRKNLYRQVLICMMEIESYLIEFLSNNEKESLNNLVLENWSDAKIDKLSMWSTYAKPAHTCYYTSLKVNNNNKVTIQLALNGLFLIQGKPISKLPDEILSHKIYKKYFGKTSFHVAPSTMGTNAYVTKEYIFKPHFKQKYVFLLNATDLVIKEIREQDKVITEYVLLPQEKFESLFPSIIANKYSQWYDRQNNLIEFRSEYYFNKENSEVKFLLDLKTKEFCDKKREKYLIDIKSNTFEEIYKKIGNRVELKEYVHLFLKGDKFSILFPRMNLSFDIDRDRNCVVSKDYPGMKIAESQQINTLLGLEQGLLLCEDSKLLVDHPKKLRKQLIVPNGNITVFKSDKKTREFFTKHEEHQQVFIEIEDIKTPPFYSYEIDCFLRKLRAEESINAWFYLAWLHAVTSHVLPDPFLGFTGTEMSLQLLQSPNCWSPKPLDDEGVFILKSIAALSPKREFYPPHLQEMQMIKWPKHIPSLAAHEAFIWIVEKLISDSTRLQFAFSNIHPSKSQVPTKNNNDKLNDSRKKLYSRAYYRNSKFYTNSGLLAPNFETVIETESLPVLAIDTRNSWASVEILNARIVALNRYSPNIDYNLHTLLFNSQQLKGVSPEGFNKNVVSQWDTMRSIEIDNPTFYRSISKQNEFLNGFRNDWLDLYLFLKKSKNREEKFNQIFLLSYLAYKGVPVDHLLFLQKISNYQHLFLNHDPPEFSNYKTEKGCNYNKNDIENILRWNFLKLKTFRKKFRNLNESHEEFIKRTDELYKTTQESTVVTLESEIANYWTLHGGLKKIVFSSEYVQATAINSVNESLNSWGKNRRLRDFIVKLNSTYKVLPNMPIVTISNFESPSSNYQKFLRLKTCFQFQFNIPHNNASIFKVLQEMYENGTVKNDDNKVFKTNQVEQKEKTNTSSTKFSFEEISNSPVRKYYLENLKESLDYYSQNAKKSPEINFKADNFLIIEYFLKLLNDNNIKLKCALTIMKAMMLKDGIVSKSLFHAELWPRVTPTNILKWLIGSIETNMKFEKTHLTVFGGIAVLWSLEQRILRCIKYLETIDSNELVFYKELENKPYENWKPSEFPQWLVFCLEQNVMIRKIQVDVARKMLNPPGGNNTVLQFSMGEGKTAVIVPILSTVLSDGRKIARIIVLKPLFNMNYNSLAQKLGGILNKRVYIFPCQRNIEFDPENVKVYQNLYDECLKNQGVIISLPDYQLSFKLKGIEKARKEDEVAKNLINTQEWLDNNVRDILDESDELLNVKYQLIYPLGNHSILDGGELRWLVAQAVLKIAREHFEDLNYKEHYKDSIELIQNNHSPQAYPNFRLLNNSKPDKAYDSLREKILNGILKGKATGIKFLELKNDEIEHVKKFVLAEEVDKHSRKITHDMFREDSNEMKIVLILRGFLTYDIFYSVLVKRFKVEYGVNFKRNDLLQAVPYRAKDVPAERAQFAHPDIAILLTHLSYYYSGLNNNQLDDLFVRLNKSPDADSEYESWIKDLPEDIVDRSVSEFSGINLNDAKQKYEILYPLLKFHPKAINFWLNGFVFPREFKQYKKKLVTTAWDLCKIKYHPLTGFSGTNDSRLLLPLTTKFYELPDLKGTNGMLLSNLLTEENNHYTCLQTGAKGIDILKQISSDKEPDSLRVLLDIGALMLELNNKQVVTAWLKLKPKAEAVVYFDNDNNLMVIDRSNRTSLLEISPYKKQLDKCIIFLDQSHTRGTDLKFPYGTIGAVTLGRGVTKDQLLQGCMRLRMLGSGHSVKFYASLEVHQNLLKLKKNKEITTSDILCWALNNTCQETTNGFTHWASFGLLFFKQEMVFKDFKNHMIMKTYANDSMDHDIVELKKLYDGNRSDDYVVKIIENKFEAIQKHFKKSILFSKDFEKMFLEIKKELILFVPNKKVTCHTLEEEQELELEVEKEEETEIERPPAAKPLKNKLHPDVDKLVKCGIFDKQSSTFLKLPHSLDDSSLKPILQHGCWSNNLYTTTDFAQTVDTLDEADEYLRPPKWLCIQGEKENMKIVLLSDFEANELMPFFNKSTALLAMLLPRHKETQERIISFPEVNIPLKLLEQLVMFSGSLYLKNDQEQDAFLSFIGFCPSPRSINQDRYFQAGLINRNGYVDYDKRQLVFNLPINLLSQFKNDPSDLIFKLYELRNYGIIPKTCHYFSIIRTGRRITFN